MGTLMGLLSPSPQGGPGSNPGPGATAITSHISHPSTSASVTVQ